VHISIQDQHLQHIYFLANQDPVDDETDSKGLASLRDQPAASSQRSQMTGIWPSLLCRIHVSCKYPITSSDEAAHLLKFRLF
jgi:hypothetical protein